MALRLNSVVKSQIFIFFPHTDTFGIHFLIPLLTITSGGRQYSLVITATTRGWCTCFAIGRMSDRSSTLPCLRSTASRRVKVSISRTRQSDLLCLKLSKQLTKSDPFTPSLEWMLFSMLACRGQTAGGRGQFQKTPLNHSILTSDWPILEPRSVVKILTATVSLVWVFLQRATTADDPSPMISCTENWDLLPIKTWPT